MMKVNELMIGDWVSMDNIPTKVYTIWDKGIGVRNTDKNYEAEGVWQLMDIEPIPLTVEIIEKNGILFECNGWSEKIYKSTFTYRGSKYSSKNIYIVIESDKRMKWCSDFTYRSGDPIAESVCYITYVHELQHALRLCGLNELADNFKI